MDVLTKDEKKRMVSWGTYDAAASDTDQFCKI